MKKAIAVLLCCALVVTGWAVSLADSFDAVFEQLRAEYPSGSLWTEHKYGGMECYAFAREVLNRLFGSYPENISGMPHGTISNNYIALRPDEQSPERANRIIDALKTGDYVRFFPQQGYIHSIVVLSVDGDNVYCVDANNVAKDTVSWEVVFSKQLLKDNLEGVFMHLSNGPIPNDISGVAGVVTITHNRAVNIRAAASGQAGLVGVAQPGESFVCVGTEPNGWYRIVFKPGEIAYVSHKITTLDTSVADQDLITGAMMQ